MSSPADQTASIRDYYDQNTRLFSRFGSSSKTRSIHRALWLPGVTTLDQALNQSNRLVLEAVQRDSEPQRSDPFLFADLGCGIGGTLIYLLQHLPAPARGVGLTISPLQARLAHCHLNQAGLSSSGMIVEGDFIHLPLKRRCAAIVSIEAFVHAVQPARYLSEAARTLQPGGRLVLIDDFLASVQVPANPAHRRWLSAYRSGWRLPGLCAVADLRAWSAGCGLNLLEDHHLTPWLRFRTLPNFLTHFILSAGARIPLRHAVVPSLLGSLALQHCLKAGLVEYHLLVFEKQP